MSKVIRISEKEAANNFTSLLERVRGGVEIVIERDAVPVAVVSPAAPGRLLSEAIAMADAHACNATLDDEFASDLEAVINSHREPLHPPEWD